MLRVIVNEVGLTVPAVVFRDPLVLPVPLGVHAGVKLVLPGLGQTLAELKICVVLLQFGAPYKFLEEEAVIRFVMLFIIFVVAFRFEFHLDKACDSEVEQG